MSRGLGAASPQNLSPTQPRPSTPTTPGVGLRGPGCTQPVSPPRSSLAHSSRTRCRLWTRGTPPYPPLTEQAWGRERAFGEAAAAARPAWAPAPGFGSLQCGVLLGLANPSAAPLQKAWLLEPGSPGRGLRLGQAPTLKAAQPAPGHREGPQADVPLVCQAGATKMSDSGLRKARASFPVVKTPPLYPDHITPRAPPGPPGDCTVLPPWAPWKIQQLCHLVRELSPQPLPVVAQVVAA